MQEDRDLRTLFNILKDFPKTKKERPNNLLERAKRYLRCHIKSLIIVDPLQRCRAGELCIGNMYNSATHYVKGYYKETVKKALELGDSYQLKSIYDFLEFNGNYYKKDEWFLHENNVYKKSDFVLYKGVVRAKKNIVDVYRVIPYSYERYASQETRQKLDPLKDNVIIFDEEEFTDLNTVHCWRNWEAKLEFSGSRGEGIFLSYDFLMSMFKFKGKRVLHSNETSFSMTLENLQYLTFEPLPEHLEEIKKSGFNCKVYIYLKNCRTKKLKFLKALVSNKGFDICSFGKVMKMFEIAFKGGKKNEKKNTAQLSLEN
jgi:hypothetical protein